jgi:hypothetical protein
MSRTYPDDELSDAMQRRLTDVLGTLGDDALPLRPFNELGVHDLPSHFDERHQRRLALALVPAVAVLIGALVAGAFRWTSADDSVQSDNQVKSTSSIELSADVTSSPPRTAPPINPHPAPPTPAAGLVIERRSMTDAERTRLDGEDERPLDCDDVGEAFWDFNPGVSLGSAPRSADEVLLEVINELNRDAREDPRTTLDYDYIPTTGWVELTDRESTTFVHTNGNWRFAIQVSGDASLGNWTRSGALVCEPDLQSSSPDP